MAYYDVRDGMNNKTLTPIVRSVNLMCALLEGVTYGNLYEEPIWKPISPRLPQVGDPACALERMFRNAATLHPDLNTTPGGLKYPVGVLFATLLDAIRNDIIANNGQKLHLRGLFLRRVASGADAEDPGLYSIHNRLAQLFAGTGSNLRHLCMPFLYIQATSPVGTSDWGSFIGACRTKTLRNLYETETKRVLGVAVLKARNCGILLDFGRPLFVTKTSRSGKRTRERIKTPSGGNSRICKADGSGCGPAASHYWCNETSTGQCSAMSD